MNTKDELTADVGRATKRCCDLWVKVYHEVTFLSNHVITILDLLRDPLSEFVTTQGIDHVYDPLSRQLGHITLIRQVLLQLLTSLPVIEDGVDGERLVHGDVQVLCVLRLEDYRCVGYGEKHLLFFSPRTISLRK